MSETRWYTCDLRQERYTATTADEAVLDYLDGYGTLPETVVVYAFAPVTLTEADKAFAAEAALDAIFNGSWEEYCDPEGGDDISPEMRAAADEFVARLAALWTPWHCEQVSSREVDVAIWVREHAPHWLDATPTPAPAPPQEPRP